MPSRCQPTIASVFGKDRRSREYLKAGAGHDPSQVAPSQNTVDPQEAIHCPVWHSKGFYDVGGENCDFCPVALYAKEHIYGNAVGEEFFEAVLHGDCHLLVVKLLRLMDTQKETLHLGNGPSEHNILCLGARNL